MDVDKIIQHLVDISKGECSITEDSILKLNNEDDQSIELGLLTLFEEIEYNREKLEASNKEKEVLLKEIHHRVKNNLQVICSLIKLQTMYINDYKAKHILNDCRLRVTSMSMIHEMLYKSNDFENIDYRDYLIELIEMLQESHLAMPESTYIKTNIPSFKLDLDTAIPLGLLINEILTNSLKYGINNKEKSEIYLIINEVKPNSFELEIGDNGSGYNDEIFANGENSLGVQLIRDLTYQLDGSIIKLDSNVIKGTHYKISFKS